MTPRSPPDCGVSVSTPLGNSGAADGLPPRKGNFAALLVLRELMHHLALETVIVKASLP